MSDEFNKGYFTTGPHHSYEAQQGAAQRQRDQQRDRDAQDAQRRQQDEIFERSMLATASAQTPGWSPNSTRSSGSGTPSAPATLLGCVQGCAWLGAVALLAYAFFGLNIQAWMRLAAWAVAGAAGGAAAGVLLYAAIVVLRIVVAVLAVLLNIAFWLALAGGAIYLLSHGL